MRAILLRLVSHGFSLSFWVFLIALLLVGLGALIFSNLLNFSDAWNVVFPSLPVINDRFFSVLVSIIRSLETSMNVPNHLSRIVGSFDYGHGYALTQTFGTFAVETMMFYFGWMYAQRRIWARQSREELERNPGAAANARSEMARYLVGFIVCLVLTGMIWAFDFFLTYAKGVIVSEEVGMAAARRYAWLAPLGTVVIMTVLSLAFAFLFEEIRRETLQITSDVGELVGHLLGLGPATTGGITGPGGGVLEGTEPDISGGRLPGTLPPPEVEALVEVWGIGGRSNLPVADLNRRWRNAEIRVDGRLRAAADNDLEVDVLYQLRNPPESDGREWYYTPEGSRELTRGGAHLDENNVLMRPEGP
jgi:hypothetical protein